MSGISWGNVIGTAVKAYLAVETGGASLVMEQAMKSVVSKVATEAFSQVLNKLGVSDGDAQKLTDVFKTAVDAYSGNTAGLTEDAQKLASDVEDASYQEGGLASAKDNLTNKMTDFISQASQKEIESTKGSGKGHGGGSWLEAIAKAMGEALGKYAEKMVKESTDLSHQAGYSSDDTGAASKFQVTMSKFQADSQMYSMLSSAFSHAIQSIGEGMKSMAQK